MDRFTILITFYLVCFQVFQLYGQEKKEIQAYPLKAEDKIKLDGWVDEAFWDKVPVAGNFKQQEPVPGNPASEATEVRVAYDEQYLYIGAIFYDSEPDKIKAFQKQRDAPLGTDDRFAFILDTY